MAEGILTHFCLPTALQNPQNFFIAQMKKLRLRKAILPANDGAEMMKGWVSFSRGRVGCLSFKSPFSSWRGLIEKKGECRKKGKWSKTR